ncbi:MAG: SDR family oxidoreductase [Rhodospirillaceae bacterium]|jgi:NAD(P)-dependent dehydrogenase (short-subunit alcohol dehydrogenase family)|nr:SDR family oxidoreductase [Rhodospirillaceae bacterium]
MRLAGKVAVITGAANGIGAATAQLFAREGAKVILADRDRVTGEALAREIGANARFQLCNVAHGAEIEAAVSAAERHFGGLDILVNNAAIQNVKPIAETSEAEWAEIIAVNLTSVFLGIKYAIEPMKKRGGGAIVNTSSTFALVGSPGYAAYHAAKGGVSSLTRAAAIDLIRHNIRVNAICPGTTDTPGLRRGVEATAADPAAALAGYLKLQPMGRFGTAEEVAAAILFLASDEASFVIGAELVADGGYTVV